MEVVYKLSTLFELGNLMMRSARIDNKTFMYAIERNLEKISSCGKKARRRSYKDPSFAYNPELNDYIKALKTLNVQHAVRDKEGKIVFDRAGNIAISDRTKYDLDLKELEKEYEAGAKVLQRRKVVLEKERDMEYAVCFYKIVSVEGIPTDLNEKEIEELKFMISDEVYEKIQCKY